MLLCTSVQVSHQSCPTLCDPIDCSMPLPCPHPSPTPRAHSNSCPSSWWCQPSHPLLTPSPPALNLSQHQDLFQGVSSSHSDGQSIGVSASASVLPINIQGWFPLGWTGWISLQSMRLSIVFSNTTVQKHQFFSTQLSLWSNPHIHTWLLGKPYLWLDGLLSIK